MIMESEITYIGICAVRKISVPEGLECTGCLYHDHKKGLCCAFDEETLFRPHSGIFLKCRKCLNAMYDTWESYSKNLRKTKEGE